MKQLPDFLKEYEADLQKYRLRSVEILVTVLNDGETTDIKSSKFLGTPLICLPVWTIRKTRMASRLFYGRN